MYERAHNCDGGNVNMTAQQPLAQSPKQREKQLKRQQQKQSPNHVVASPNINEQQKKS